MSSSIQRLCSLGVVVVLAVIAVRQSEVIVRSFQSTEPAELVQAPDVSAPRRAPKPPFAPDWVPRPPALQFPGDFREIAHEEAPRIANIVRDEGASLPADIAVDTIPEDTTVGGGDDEPSSAVFYTKGRVGRARRDSVIPAASIPGSVTRKGDLGNVERGSVDATDAPQSKISDFKVAPRQNSSHESGLEGGSRELASRRFRGGRPQAVRDAEWFEQGASVPVEEAGGAAPGQGGARDAGLSAVRAKRGVILFTHLRRAGGNVPPYLSIL